MTSTTTPSAVVHTLHLQQQGSLDRIDQALDRGDRRAFRAWCKRHASLSARLSTLLLTIATAPEV